MPAPVPVTRPVRLSTVATAVLLLLKVPPVESVVKVVDVPWQIGEVPVIVAGAGPAGLMLAYVSVLFKEIT